MAEETNARIERLEKESQESRAQMTEMMELIRTLIRDKGLALGFSSQNETAQPDQRREELVYPTGFTPPYAPNVHVAQAPPMQQTGGFSYGYTPPPTQVNEVGQNSEQNMAEPITVSDLDDPKEQEKLRNESSEQSENNEAQRKIELIEERLKATEGSDVYGMVDAYKMILVQDLVLPFKFKGQLSISMMTLNVLRSLVYVLQENDGTYEQWQVVNSLFSRQFEWVDNKMV